MALTDYLTEDRTNRFIYGLNSVGNSLLNGTPPTYGMESAKNTAGIKDANTYRQQLMDVVTALGSADATKLAVKTGKGELTDTMGNTTVYDLSKPANIEGLVNRILDPKAVGAVKPAYGQPVATGGSSQPAGAGANPLAGLMGAGGDIMKLFGQGGGAEVGGGFSGDTPNVSVLPGTGGFKSNF
jgi:hypothetical protein